MSFKKLIATSTSVAAVLCAAFAFTAQASLNTINELSPAGRNAASPDLAVGPDGSINLIWVDRGAVKPPDPHAQHGPPAAAGAARSHTHKAYNDLFFTRSTDGGKTFAPPVRVNSKAGEVWGFATSKPRLAVSKSGVIHVFYSGNRRDPAAPRQAVDARYTRSTDGGKTFEPARTLNREGKGMDDGELDEAHCFGTMGVAPNGDVYAYWIDTRHMKSEADNGAIYGGVSRNEGKTFEQEQMIAQNEACPCCQLNVTFAPNGKPYLSFRGVAADGSRNSVVTRSDDRGKSYGARVPTSDKKWDIKACPLKPTTMAVDKDGRVYAAWYAGEEQPAGVFFSVSENNGQSFAKPQRMHAEAKLSDHAALSVGADGKVHVLWDAKVGETKRIYLRSSTDRGKTFGPVSEIEMPAGNADFPVLAATKSGMFIAWQLNGRIMFQVRPELVAQK